MKSCVAVRPTGKGKTIMTIVKRVVYAICVLGVWLSLTGCNTVEGVGKDIERGGEAIQDVAD
jgi:entericidin B